MALFKNMSSDSSLLISTGVFQYELTQNFLDILSARANSYLEHLYSICLNEKDKAARYNNYLIGLKDIDTWGNDILNQEIQELTRECPNIQTIYVGVIRRYISDYFKGYSCQDYKIKVPSLLTFIHTFYRELATDESVRTMEVFRLYSMNRKYVFMDSMRRSLYNILKKPIEQIFTELTQRSQDTTLRVDRRIPESLRTPPSMRDSRIGSSMHKTKKTPNPNSVFQNAVDSAMRAVETPTIPNTPSVSESRDTSKDSSRKSFRPKTSFPEEPQTMPSLFSYRDEPMPSSRRRVRNDGPVTHKSIDITSVDLKEADDAKKHSPKTSPRD